MFTKVHHWLLAALAGPFAAAAFTLVGFAVHKHHEFVAMALMFASVAAVFWPFICVRNAVKMWWENKREQRLERIRMETRRERYNGRQVCA